MREWSAIAAAAGAPAPRLAEEKERLFGASKPKVVFWRDNSMWCPYCARLWLLLEALRVPYTTKTIPLSRYLKPGEKKPAEYTSQVPSGVVPALQFEQADGTYGPAVDGVARLFDALLSDAATAAPPCEALEAALPRFEMARRGYEACAGAPTRLAPDACFDMGVGEACATLDAALAGYDFTARARTFFGAIASDRTTLARTNLRYANPHFAPDAGAARLIDHEGVACTAEDRRDAAARLAKNHAAVAKFALRAASADNRPDKTLVAAVDDALRATADSRLGGDASLPPGPPRVADALLALSYNVGVPRDMARGPAAAFRGALRDLAAQQATPPRAPDGKWETAGNGDCWLKFTWCLGAAVGVGSSARLCGW
ncbi:chloride channel [Aureococcus anophagefferens]|nr:chloride channel [Aureococcus anophagefferens]